MAKSNFTKVREKLKEETAHKHPNASQLTINSGAASESAKEQEAKQTCFNCAALNHLKNHNYCRSFGEKMTKANRRRIASVGKNGTVRAVFMIDMSQLELLQKSSE